MGQCVVDTSFLAKANGLIAGVKPGNLLHTRIAALDRVVQKKDKVRYNKKLLREYEPHIRERRNDIIDQFVELLDSKDAIRVQSSSLRRQDSAVARKCRWPKHDDHVLAAAINGEKVTIHVTENDLGACAKAVKKFFGFRVNHVA